MQNDILTGTVINWEIVFFYLNVFFLFFFLIFLITFYFKRFLLTHRRMLSHLRYEKVRRFNSIAECVMSDILAAVKESHPEQAYALLPLLLDVKKLGENLFEKQLFFHILLFPKMEKGIKQQIQRLIQVEKLIKSVPRSQFSEDFSHIYDSQMQGQN